MKPLIFRALWGMTGSLPEQIARIAAAGYDGIEMWPRFVAVQPDELHDLLRDYSLQLITAGAIQDVNALEEELAFLAGFKPLKINVQDGRDAMTRDEGSRFFEEALRVEARIGVPVVHETHRGMLLFTPWDTAAYLRAFPTLKITADYSHWVNVCERLPDDQADALALANAHAHHIHGRVGYAEGPQVPDPSAPEYSRELAWHEQQWEQIRQHRMKAGDAVLTFTPEYGPPQYLHTLPHTNAPVADLWEVCLWAGHRARGLLNVTSSG
jgi:sugar phosphate isomerase/epimerase